MSISDMTKQHTIVDINDYVHVIDGKVICYEPDTIDFESEAQVKNLFDIATNLYKNGFYTEEYGHGNTRFVISGSKEYIEKCAGKTAVLPILDAAFTGGYNAIKLRAAGTTNADTRKKEWRIHP